MRARNAMTDIPNVNGCCTKVQRVVVGGKGQHQWIHWLISMSLSLCISALWVAPSAAQSVAPFEHEVGLGSVEKTGSVAIGDLDGDGDLDIVQGNQGQSYIYLNDSQGRFDDSSNRRSLGGAPESGRTAVCPSGIQSDASQALNEQPDTESVAVGDLNGDGFLDIIQGNIGQSYLYFNDGQGHFYDDCRQNLGDPQGTWSVAIGDLNGDGALDIVQGNSGSSYYHLNDGEGNFPIGQPFSNNQDVYSIALGDLNHDNRLDIVVGIKSAQSCVYLNSASSTRPFLNLGSCTNFGSVYDTTSVALGDLNGDGHLDIIQENSGQSYFYLNDQQGNFPFSFAFGDNQNTHNGIAVADLNGDGNLDIVQSNGVPAKASYIYFNNGRGSFDDPIAFGSNNFDPTVAVADLDGDSDLDIIQGNRGQQSKIYLNVQLSSIVGDRILFGWTNANAHSIALADLDGNGFLDIVQGNFGPSYVYWNHSAANNDDINFQHEQFGSGGSTWSVAVGDLNSNSMPDVVQSNSRDVSNNRQLTGAKRASLIFFDRNTDNFTSFGDGYDTFSLALGDLDNDGNLDIVQGNLGASSRIYRNEGTKESPYFPNSKPFGNIFPNPKSRIGDCLDGFFSTVALGDLNRDGNLDIVQGNNGQSFVYLNDGKGDFATKGIPFGSTNATYSVALGDLDNDGDLDIVQGNFIGQSYIYLNDGQGGFRNSIPLGSTNQLTWSVAVGDLNGDGFLDIVQGNRTQAVDCDDPGTGGRTIGDDDQSYIYLNDGEGHFPFRGIGFGKGAPTTAVALGDLNQDGLLDIVLATSRQSAIYLNQLKAAKLPNNGPRITIGRPVPNFSLDPKVWKPISDSEISIPYALFDDGSDPVGRVAAFYSLDGGGNWQPAIAASRTQTTSLPTAPWGFPHEYIWDTFKSGLFGRSDNVVIRMVAYSQPPTTTIPMSGTYQYTNAVAGPIQWPSASATTFPFHVQGTQVQVITDTNALTTVANALVYRLPKDQTRDALPIGGVDTPFHTDGQGYLQGRGTIAIGDTLVALLPISSTNSYTIYATNIDIMPSVSGLNAFTVTNPGIQKLVVSKDNPLLLFNLDISLEWDARNDAQFLNQLAFDLRRASELLFDWSNGQVALGRLTLHHDRDDWQEADIQIYATNRMRPNATIGGIVEQPRVDITAQSTITYTHGNVRMGVVWNRNGDSSGNLGEDWPAALAHELGHYALYLNDHYLGLEGKMLTRIDTCGDSAMSNPYRDDYSEFLMELGNGCANTLAAQTTGRADWSTIAKFYEPLTNTQQIDGPTSLPLAVTQLITTGQVSVQRMLLDSPFLYVTQGGSPIQVDRGARAFLFQDFDEKKVPGSLIDLGTSQFARIRAYGARKDARVCVYQLDIESPRLGCAIVTSNYTELELKALNSSNWQPVVIVSPRYSDTVDITVTVSGLDNKEMQARLYPVNVLTPTETITLTPAQNETYTGTLKLTHGDTAGYVYIWVDEPDTKEVPRREIVTDYTLGGSPPFGCGGSGCAPRTSADGQVMLYGRELEFKKGEFYTLQATTTNKNLPAWASVVGQAYRLEGTNGTPPLDQDNVSIGFQYLGRDVPSGEEQWLRIYYQEDTDTEWQMLDTTRNITYNVASAFTKGEGLYALMSSTEITLTKGWNLIAYPIQERREITDALASVEGDYEVVCGYEPDNQDNPTGGSLKIFETRNGGKKELTHLNFGQGYWIKTIKRTTLRFKAATSLSLQPLVSNVYVSNGDTPPTCGP